ncbi:hypothetical protein L5515_016425 [Caenorhabditis briggsae]|uniref:Uncharacterized protein n=1 Tax=Caenorhabditis briggsae TaxID=6238 RepID=A0AAE9FC31_CAEBR|nr:hypothetical protein L5515_016425 [Caenorhabditis briggsae]
MAVADDPIGNFTTNTVYKTFSGTFKNIEILTYCCLFQSALIHLIHPKSRCGKLARKYVTMFCKTAKELGEAIHPLLFGYGEDADYGRIDRLLHKGRYVVGGYKSIESRDSDEEESDQSDESSDESSTETIIVEVVSSEDEEEEDFVMAEEIEFVNPGVSELDDEEEVFSVVSRAEAQNVANVYRTYASMDSQTEQARIEEALRADEYLLNKGLIKAKQFGETIIVPF